MKQCHLFLTSMTVMLILFASYRNQSTIINKQHGSKIKKKRSCRDSNSRLHSTGETVFLQYIQRRTTSNSLLNSFQCSRFLISLYFHFRFRLHVKLFSLILFSRFLSRLLCQLQFMFYSVFHRFHFPVCLKTLIDITLFAIYLLLIYRFPTICITRSLILRTWKRNQYLF